MAVAPLFVADIATMKSELRLSGLKANSDGEQIFERGVQSARVALYMKLGPSTAASFVARAEVDNPTATLDIQRKACSLAEVELVRLEMLRTMPVRVADASGDEQELFNDEGVWRDISPRELRLHIEGISAYVEELVELITGADDLGDDSMVHTWDGSRGSSADPVRFPTGTIYPEIGKFTGNLGIHYLWNTTTVPVRFQLPE